MSTESKVAFVAHGFMDDYLTPWWGPVHDNLEEMGYEVRKIHFDGLLRTVDSPSKYAEEVGSAIEEELYDMDKAQSLDEVLVAGHSMGGLVSRYAVEELGYVEEVDKIATFGSPQQGTEIARPFKSLYEGARDMVPGSGFLEELNGDGVEEDIEYYNFYTPDDSAFLHYDNAEIPVEADNVHNIQVGVPNTKILNEKLVKSLNLGLDLMYDTYSDFQRIAVDAAFSPWKLANPTYWTGLIKPERTEKRLNDLKEIIETDPEEFYTGHTTMFFNEELWEKVEECLENGEPEPGENPGQPTPQNFGGKEEEARLQT